MGAVNEVFEKFLKENNILDQYMENAMHPGLNFVTRARALIDYSFTWRDTPQGESYWYHLHEEWTDVAYKKGIAEQLINIQSVIDYIQLNGDDLWTD